MCVCVRMCVNMRALVCENGCEDVRGRLCMLVTMSACV